MGQIRNAEDKIMATNIEETKTLVRRFFAAIEVGDFRVFDEIVAEGYDDHLPGQQAGRGNLKKYFGGLRAAFPLVTGHYSVHTSSETPVRGEAGYAAIAKTMKLKPGKPLGG